MADNFGQTFHYIRMNSKLTVEETCGNLIGTQCLVESSNKLNWTVKLPPILNKNYRNLIDVPQSINGQPPIQKSEENGEERTFYIGHLTDVHIDPFYLGFSNATCKGLIILSAKIVFKSKF